MKQCRFCDADIPFYGSDTCYACQLQADWDSMKARQPNTVKECAKEDLENNL